MDHKLLDVKETTISTPIAGLHIVANFGVAELDKLRYSEYFRTLINRLIQENNLSKVGEVYHNFDNGGYTAIVCLTESHLSIHTWPENNYLTFDIFLSNYLKDNRATTRLLYHKIKEYFDATVLFEQIIDR